MECVVRRLALKEINQIHPRLNSVLKKTQNRYLIPHDVLTQAGLQALLHAMPIPVTRLAGDVMVALGEPRLLIAAHAYLHPQDRIPVIEYRGLNSEDIGASMWARNAIHHLYTAHHPDGYIVQLNNIRAAIPDATMRDWCPSVSSARQFSDVAGISRNTFRSRKHGTEEQHPVLETPLQRIREGVNDG